ncbi:MAG: S8 family serine peptidase [Gammaproteobacteria bacterium]|nr:S8 family serine peptidase [Gammaproteobacteria bacterium]
MQNDEIVKVLVVMSDQADIRALNWELHDSKASMELRHHTVMETLRNQAKRSQGELLDSLEANKAAGGILGYTPHWIVNAVVVAGTVDAIRELAARPDVERVEADLVVELIEPVESNKVVDNSKDTAGIGITPGVVAVGARRVWNELGIDGTGVVVGELDTGVDGTHPSLQANWRGNFAPIEECWLDAADLNHSTPQDTHGHGTHTMGTVSGIAADDTIGVAPGAVWIASNIINGGTGSAFDNGVIASFEWLADPDGDPLTTEDVPAVVQNSWGVNENFTGYYDCDSRWWDAIDNCEAAGVVVTWSAGNEGPGSESLRSPADRATSPGNCFSVGSTEHTAPYNISSFSSRGPSGCGGEFAMKPEISAPGSDIYSAQSGGGYTYKSGTSMAGPHIAGVVALMRASNPNVDVITIKQVLMDTAVDLGTAGEDNTYGHGFVDAYAAVLAVMGGVGTVEGYITDSLTGLPIEGALVKKAGASNQALTDATGFYSMTMPIGDFDFEVSFFGYNQGAFSVTIPEDAAVNGDFALVQLPTSVVSGFVYGPDNNIVPGAIVKAMDTPVTEAIADASGFYSLELPSGSGSNYTLRARFNGLGRKTHNIELLADMTLDFYLPELTAEDFESGDFTSYDWDQDSTPWTVTSAAPYEGTYSAKSGGISHSDASDLSITMEVSNSDELSFWYKVSSEPTYDFLRFFIDGSEVQSWSGEVSWTQFSTTVDPGEHTFTWSYTKDSSVSDGDDAGYIDFVEFPEHQEPGVPGMALSAGSFEAIVEIDGSDEQSLTINNVGTAPLSYAIALTENGVAEKTTSPVPFKELQKGEEDDRVAIDPLTGSGGPDGYGYGWTDSDEGGVVYNWIDISSSGNPGPSGDDQSTGPHNLGFDFSYYGNTFDSVNICSNGFASFSSSSTSYSHQGIPSPSDPNNLLAAFWDDLNPSASGSIYYLALPDQFVIQYQDVVHYNSNTPETFQIILNADGSIIYNYETVSDGSGCSVGIENGAGDDGLQVAFNSSYLHSGLAIRFSEADPLTWVIADPLSGNIGVSGEQMIAVNFDATGLAAGTYEAVMTVTSNDPANSSVQLPITMEVTDGLSAAGDALPNVVRLNGAVPNPFNPMTEIKFSLPHASHVELKVYDVSGRLISNLLSENMDAGSHSITWMGRDNAGKSVASGTYFMRLNADGETNVKSMVLVR